MASGGTSTANEPAALPASVVAALPPAGSRVVVAMSGGVDSSVAAAVARAHGCETIGVTLRLSDAASDGAPARAGACCAGTDIADARAVADRLGIAHYVLDYASAFRTEVMDDFADQYMAGRTPVPCVTCNQTVKFRDLLGVAEDLGADAMLTGHYVQRFDGAAGPELHRAVDPGKDQSYFLFATTPAQLARLRFPLGGLDKAATRALAERFGLRVANKPDSQDICFVPGGDYRAVVRLLRPDADAPGDIVDESGRALGRHDGLIGFTIGQRRGVGVGGRDAPLYVLRLEPETRRVVVGPRAALAVAALRLDALNWLGEGPPHDRRVMVKLRSMAPLAAAWLRDGELRFDTPQHGVAPGQAAVLYDGSRVLGGGFIAATEGVSVPASVPAI